MTEPVQQSWWWTTSSSGDGSASSYTRADLSKIAKVIGGVSGSQGVAPRFGDCYAVTTPAAYTVQVGTGAALVDGKPHMCTTSGCLTIPAASGAGNTRIDRIALRADWNAGGASPQTVRIVRIPGVSGNPPSASDAPLTQTSETIYDLPLYQITVNTAGSITTITDERYFSSCALSGSSGIQTNAYGQLVIASCGLTTDKYADASISSSKIAANAVSSDKIPDNSISSSKIAASAISTDKILNNAISSCLIAASSIYSSKIKTGAVVTDTIANDAVDDTKVGNRVPQFYRRQGGNSTDWTIAGTTTYTPTTVRMQAGHASLTTNTSGYASVTFPVSFSNKPLVFVQAWQGTQICHVTSVTTSDFTVLVWDHMPISPYHAARISNGVELSWLAIGPE